MKAIPFILNGMKWVVKFVSCTTILKRYGDDDGSELMGFCHLAANTIYIEKTQRPDMRMDTLFHELTHAFLSPATWSKDGKSGKVDEELVCNLIASGLNQLYRSGDLAKLLAIGGDNDKELHDQ